MQELSTTDHDISIEVETLYLQHESVPDDSRYVFAYTITIKNTGSKPAKLMTRRWLITDSDGKVQEVEVEGEGVVGEQPYIRPGENFKYTSGTMLRTPLGVMQGSYQMIGDSGESFEAPIEPFTLSIPRVLH